MNDTAGKKLNIVLYQPEIPQNAGNVARTCVAIGAKLWLVRPLGFRLEDRYLKRAGLDYWQYLDWAVVDDWAVQASSLPAEAIWCFSKSATRLYTEVRFQLGDFLIFGSETRGLPLSLWRATSPRRCGSRRATRSAA